MSSEKQSLMIFGSLHSSSTLNQLHAKCADDYDRLNISDAALIAFATQVCGNQR
jgi:hypothetical protein